MHKLVPLLIILLISGALAGGYALSAASRAPSPAAPAAYPGPISTSFDMPLPATVDAQDAAAAQAPKCPQQPLMNEPDYDFLGGVWLKSVTEQNAEADVIVHGVVLAVHSRAIILPFPRSQHDAPGAKVRVIPQTDSTLRVLNVYKGSVGDQITVTEDGGILSATDQYPAIRRFPRGFPLFRADGEYVLFLKRLPANDPTVPNDESYMLVYRAVPYEVRGSLACRPGDTDPPTVTQLVTWIQHGGEPPTPTAWPQGIQEPTAPPAPTPGPAYPQP